MIEKQNRTRKSERRTGASRAMAQQVAASERRLGALLDSIEAHGAAEIVVEPRELLDAGEWGVAFETLVDIVLEGRPQLTGDHIDEIEALGAHLAEVSPFAERTGWREVRAALGRSS